MYRCSECKEANRVIQGAMWLLKVRGYENDPQIAPSLRDNAKRAQLKINSHDRNHRAQIQAKG